MESAGLTVWAGIWSQGVIGPYLFNSTVTGQSYLEMLNDYFYPIFCQLRGNESIALNQQTAFRVLLDYESIFLMQDGAPAHYASDVRDWLDENFSARWIGRRGAID